MPFKRIILSLTLSIVSLSLFAAEPGLREKIGQMLIIGFEGKIVDKHAPIAALIEKNNLGGVILFDFNVQSQTFDKNIESPEQVKQLNQQLQEVTHNANTKHHRADLPLFISVDYEGGQVNRLHPRYGFPCVPSPKAVGNMSVEEGTQNAVVMANTLKNAGINLNFFPTLDVDVNPENPIIGKKQRSFSAVPEAVAQYAQLFSTEFLNRNIQCAYKHFPGHGSSTADTHLGFADVTDTWSDQELIPYMQLLSQQQHCGMIMIAHIVNRKLDPLGVPATLSQNMINGLLRHDLQFDGVVVTDDMQMRAITDYYGLEAAITLSINAGTDMLIFGNQMVDKPQDPAQLIDIIEQQVLRGAISEQRIDEAYQRIVKMKQG